MYWNPWVELVAVAMLALAGVLLGRWFSRLPKPYWVLGYFIPLALVFVYGAAMYRPAFAVTAPVSWMMMGRNRFAVIGFIAAMILTTPISRLRQQSARILVSVLLALMVVHMSVWPFLAPAFNRKYLSTLRTQMDSDGICRQSNDYNCGPAAAVTALRRLGFPAEEGEIAILAHTSPATGTPPDILARALQRRYQVEGLVSEYRVFHSLSELKATNAVTLVVIKYTFWLDHYVTVFETTNEEIIVGDPYLGLRRFTHEEFVRKWRFVGVTLRRR